MQQSRWQGQVCQAVPAPGGSRAAASPGSPGAFVPAGWCLQAFLEPVLVDVLSWLRATVAGSSAGGLEPRKPLLNVRYHCHRVSWLSVPKDPMFDFL